MYIYKLCVCVCVCVCVYVASFVCVFHYFNPSPASKIITNKNPALPTECIRDAFYLYIHSLLQPYE